MRIEKSDFQVNATTLFVFLFGIFFFFFLNEYIINNDIQCGGGGGYPRGRRCTRQTGQEYMIL